MVKKQTLLILFFMLLVVLLVAGCGHTSGTELRDHTANPKSPSTSPKAKKGAGAVSETTRGIAIFSLLANSELIKVSPASGRIEDKVSLGTPPAAPWFDNHYLAASTNGRTIFALVPAGSDGSFRVAVINAAIDSISKRYRLPKGLVFRSLTVGPKTGLLYLFGNQPVGKEIHNFGGRYRAEEAIVAVLNPKSGKILKSKTIRKAHNGRDWFVYTGTVSPDEKLLFVSYHGTNTTGIDWIKNQPKGLNRCQAHSPAGQGCIYAHGNVEVYKGKLLATLGDPPKVEETGQTGGIIKKWNTRLKGDHLMEFALNKPAGHLYAIGSCGYTGGLSRVDLKTGRVKLLAPTRTGLASSSVQQQAVCGDWVVNGEGSLLVVGKISGNSAQAGTPGSLLLVDGESGRKLRAVTTPAEPVDALILPRP